MTQVVEHLPRKCMAQNSNPSTTKMPGWCMPSYSPSTRKAEAGRWLPGEAELEASLGHGVRPCLIK
jgi:hypothetical protein